MSCCLSRLCFAHLCLQPSGHLWTLKSCIENKCKNWQDDSPASGSTCCVPSSPCATNLSDVRDPSTHGSKPTCALGTGAHALA